jgi:hypothetical protein
MLIDELLEMAEYEGLCLFRTQNHPRICLVSSHRKLLFLPRPIGEIGYEGGQKSGFP